MQMDRKGWIFVGIMLGAVALIALRSCRRGRNALWDEVEEASEGSFPASDAPSWTPVRGVGTAENSG